MTPDQMTITIDDLGARALQLATLIFGVPDLKERAELTEAIGVTLDDDHSEVDLAIVVTATICREVARIAGDFGMEPAEALRVFAERQAAKT